MIDFSKVDKVLTFFAHPDDEVLGAGGTLSKLSRGGTGYPCGNPCHRNSF